MRDEVQRNAPGRCDRATLPLRKQEDLAYRSVDATNPFEGIDLLEPVRNELSADNRPNKFVNLSAGKNLEVRHWDLPGTPECRLTPRISDAPMPQRKNKFIHNARSLHALVRRHSRCSLCSTVQ